MDLLSLGCLYQTGDDAVGLESFFRSRSEAHFAEDDHFAKGLLCMIVGGRHAWDTEKGEEIFLFRADEIRSQGFGRLERKGPFADGVELCEKVFFHSGG